MWRTSARGRTQFSVENPNTVSQPMSRRHGDPDEAGQVLLALGVTVGPGRPRRFAQRPLPSMMQATWSRRPSDGAAAATSMAASWRGTGRHVSDRGRGRMGA